jgi:hypothetical protein
MSQENVEIVRRFFEAQAQVGEAYWKQPYSNAAAFQAGTLPPEAEALMSFVHRDLEWTPAFSTKTYRGYLGLLLSGMFLIRIDVAMARILFAALVVAVTLVPSTANAEPSAFKMDALNFGNVSLGSTVSGTIKLTNRSDVPALITGWSFSDDNGNSGLREFPAIGGPCQTLRNAGTPLRPGETCVETLSFEPASPGAFRAKTCIFTDPYFTKPALYPCSFVRGHVREML